jgi:hypothetical protein
MGMAAAHSVRGSYGLLADNREDQMNQSTKIVGFIVFAFVVFITVNGKLPIYWGFLMGAGTKPAVSVTSNTQTSAITPSTITNAVTSLSAGAGVAGLAGALG